MKKQIKKVTLMVLVGMIIGIVSFGLGAEFGREEAIKYYKLVLDDVEVRKLIDVIDVYHDSRDVYYDFALYRNEDDEFTIRWFKYDYNTRSCDNFERHY